MAQATPGHFYSPLTTEGDRERALGWTEVPGVDIDETRQLAEAPGSIWLRKVR